MTSFYNSEILYFLNFSSPPLLFDNPSLTIHGRHPSTLNQHFNATLIIQSNQLVSSLIDIYFTNLLPKFEFQLFMLWIVVFAWFCSMKNIAFEFFWFLILSSLPLIFFDFRLSFRTICLCSFESTRFLWKKRRLSMEEKVDFKWVTKQG